jgi:nucleoside-diphosphate-sugar epimerase
VDTPDTQFEGDSSRRILVTGAAGFVGTHFCRRLTAAGYAVTGLARKMPTDADAVPGVRYVTGDIRDRASLSPNDFADCGAVLHLVGIIAEVRGQGQTFQSVHVDGTRHILDAARSAWEGTERSGRPFVYLSAQGASSASKSEYARTKAEAERLVQASGLPFVIFRPSIVLGKGAEFLKQMEGLIRRPPLTPVPLPFIPIPGNGRNRFQPVHVDDLADAVLACLTTPAARGQTFPIGGEDTVTFDELMNAIQAKIGVRKPLFHAPMPLMFLAASVLEALLPRPPVTVDQLTMLGTDNICDNAAVRDVLGVFPQPFAEALARCYDTAPPVD